MYSTVCETLGFFFLLTSLKSATTIVSAKGNPDLVSSIHDESTRTSDNIEHGARFLTSTRLNDHEILKEQSSNLQQPRFSTTCPQMCVCKYKNYFGRKVVSVNCSNQDLKYVPSLPATSRVVYLQGNNIKSLECDSFSGLTKLQTLILSGNQLQNLSNCSFQDLASLEKLDLSNNNITEIPTALFDPLKKLLKLNISSNLLREITNQPFKNLTNLQCLDLSRNILKQIRNGTFQGLTSLKKLSLKHNSLLYLPSTFEINAFTGLSSLEVLELHGNQREFAKNLSYPHRPLSILTGLRNLTLDGHPQPLGDGFSTLNNLISLAFDKAGSTCNFTHMPKTFFSHMNTSQPLDISLRNCRISFLPPDVFKYTPTINQLNLEGNAYLHFDGFEIGSYGLNGTSLFGLNINGIMDAHFESPGSHITNTTFKNLKNTKLRYLTVEHNYLQVIHLLSLHDLPPTLEYLSLAGNRLSLTAIFRNIIILKQLKILKLSRQNIYTRLSRRRVSHDLESYEDETKLSLAKPLNKRYDKFCDARVDYHIIVVPKRLEELYFHYIKGDVNNYSGIKVVNNDRLRIFDYSQNNIRCISGVITGCPALEHLDVSKNIISKLNLSTLSEFPSLKFLDISRNMLGESLASDVDGILFSNLTKLETLDLHANSIKALAPAAFSFNTNLSVIILSYNQLSDFSPNLYNNNKLVRLDLSTNTLTGFSVSTCEQFMSIKDSSKKFQVSIADNKFICDCNNLRFFHLIVYHPELFSDVESFECRLPDGKKISYTMLAEFLPVLGLDCMVQSLFVYLLSVFFLVLMALGISSTFYYKRWQWRYLHYLGETKLHVGAIHFVCQQQKHAFVTYNQDDSVCRWLVKRKVLPKLHQFGLSIVFGETDFPGQPVASSSASAVASTKKSLVVFNKDMFEDSDREFEVNLAIMHELYMRKPVLVPVLLLDTNGIELDNMLESDPRQVQATNHERNINRNENGDQHSIYFRDEDYEPWMDRCNIVTPGLSELSDWQLSLFEDMLASFPPEISVFLQGQGHRCLVYDGGSQQFWTSLQNALLEENYS